MVMRQTGGKSVNLMYLNKFNATIRGMVKIIQHISVSVCVELLGAESDYMTENT